MTMTGAERQQRWREKKGSVGLVPVTVLVPAVCATGFTLAARAFAKSEDAKTATDVFLTVRIGDGTFRQFRG